MIFSSTASAIAGLILTIITRWMVYLYLGLIDKFILKFKYYETSLNIISDTLDFKEEKTYLTEVYLAFLNSLRSS